MIIQTSTSTAQARYLCLAAALLAGLTATACGQSPQAAPVAPQSANVGSPVPVQVSADAARSSSTASSCGTLSAAEASKYAKLALADATVGAQIAMPTAVAGNQIAAPAAGTAPAALPAPAAATKAGCPSGVIKDQYGNPVITSDVVQFPAPNLGPEVASLRAPAPAPAAADLPAATLPNLPPPAPAAAPSLDPAQFINGIAQVVSLVTTLTNAAGGSQTK